MTVVENREVLTQEYGELSMEPGGESTRDWVGVGTPSSHGYLPTQSAETRSVASGLAFVTVNQAEE
jgi:hypothetical protein